MSESKSEAGSNPREVIPAGSKAKVPVVPLTDDELAQLRNALSRRDWNHICEQVKATRDGQYPDDFVSKVISSGVLKNAQSRWSVPDKRREASRLAMAEFSRALDQAPTAPPAPGLTPTVEKAAPPPADVTSPPPNAAISAPTDADVQALADFAGEMERNKPLADFLLTEAKKVEETVKDGKEMSQTQVEQFMRRARRAAKADDASFFVTDDMRDQLRKELGAKVSDLESKVAECKAAERECVHCLKTAAEMPRCKGCLSVYYCSKECQKAGRSMHTNVCNIFKNGFNAVASRAAREAEHQGKSPEQIAADVAQVCQAVGEAPKKATVSHKPAMADAGKPLAIYGRLGLDVLELWKAMDEKKDWHQITLKQALQHSAIFEPDPDAKADPALLKKLTTEHKSESDVKEAAVVEAKCDEVLEALEQSGRGKNLTDPLSDPVKRSIFHEALHKFKTMLVPWLREKSLTHSALVYPNCTFFVGLRGIDKRGPGSAVCCCICLLPAACQWSDGKETKPGFAAMTFLDGQQRMVGQDVVAYRTFFQVKSAIVRGMQLPQGAHTCVVTPSQGKVLEMLELKRNMVVHGPPKCGKSLICEMYREKQCATQENAVMLHEVKSVDDMRTSVESALLHPLSQYILVCETEIYDKAKASSDKTLAHLKKWWNIALDPM